MKNDSTDFRPSSIQGVHINPPKKTDHIDIARQALAAQSRAVGKLADGLGKHFNDAVNKILSCRGRVVVCGMGKSGLVGKKLVATLASTGTPSFYLHPAEAFHGDLGMLTTADLVILISYSGETEEVIKLIPSLKQFGNQIIAMTAKSDSTLGKHADIWLDISVEREVCPNNLAPTTSTLVTMALGDALAVSLINARDFQPMDFAKFHPGGSLGKKLLTKVSDVMHTNLPTVTSNTLIRECLFTMTNYRMGIVLIMERGELMGILTDGDLRRALLKDELATQKPVSLFSTKSPETIDANCRLIDAENLMQSKKIRTLIVTNNNGRNVCGVLEIFD
jgi:arabinose-5-phosphate isomerase